MPRCRDVYLKIERMPGYSPLAFDDAERNLFRRDCMFNHGHENGTIPDPEVATSRLDALVYREYLDSGYTTPNMAPLVTADINEPAFDRRIPGAVLYADPGERLFVHVLNGDDSPHSFHVHGLVYGIDSDGAWPFGVHGLADPGPRSDTICPSQIWTYVFDATQHTIGAVGGPAPDVSAGCRSPARHDSHPIHRQPKVVPGETGWISLLEASEVAGRGRPVWPRTARWMAVHILHTDSDNGGRGRAISLARPGTLDRAVFAPPSAPPRSAWSSQIRSLRVVRPCSVGREAASV
jgi:hypothetical protein